MGCFYATCLIFIFVVLGSSRALHGFGIWPFIKYIKEELLHRARHVVVGVGAAADDRQAGEPRVPQAVVGLVIPAGYSFNLDGTSIYLTMAADLHRAGDQHAARLWHQITLLAVLLLTSKGASGVTGAASSCSPRRCRPSATFRSRACAMILGIDRFMSEARALTNLIGNGVATVVVGRWCREVDMKRVRSTLAGETAAEAEDRSRCWWSTRRAARGAGTARHRTGNGTKMCVARAAPRHLFGATRFGRRPSGSVWNWRGARHDSIFLWRRYASISAQMLRAQANPYSPSSTLISLDSPPDPVR
jgi:hypothetical protein